MKYFLLSFSIFVFTLKGFGADSLDISRTQLSTPYPSIFTGMSSMSLNDQVIIDTDYSGATLSSALSDTILALTRPLGIRNFRFPGGTIGNFYHFHGKGYGIDTSETNCAPGRIGFPWANSFVKFDRKADKNIIDYFIAEMQAYQQAGESVDVNFRLNSMTHFYKGDLIPFSDSIQYIISVYLNNNTALLNSNGDRFLDSTNISIYALSLYNMQQNGLFKRIKDKLLHTPGFYSRFRENLDALDYLKAKHIPVSRVEIGNETDGQYIIYDDDLSYSGYDCQSNTIFSDTLFVNFPIKYFFEGLLKNWIVSSLYADSIKARYNLPCGIPAAVRFTYLQPDSSYHPVFMHPYNLSAKTKDLWNAYYGLQPNIRALIPHLYFQNYISCDDYSLFPNKPFLNKLSEAFIRSYCDNSILYNLRTISSVAGYKPLWVTEWNFTENSYATGTFLQALYIYHFLRKSVQIYEQYPRMTENWNYHLLASSYYPWPLVRSGTDTITQVFYAQKQIMYEPFYLWSTTLHDPVKKVVADCWPAMPDVSTDVFVSNDNSALYILYTNTDSVAHRLALSGLSLQNGNQALAVASLHRHILQAQDFTATNYTYCSYINDRLDSNQFRVIDDEPGNSDSLELPALSMGKFSIQLKNAVFTRVQNQLSAPVRIYPNPAKDQITVEMMDGGAVDHAYLLIDALGQISASGKLSGNSGRIGLEGLASGAYTLKLKLGSQDIENQIIIIK